MNQTGPFNAVTHRCIQYGLSRGSEQWIARPRNLHGQQRKARSKVDGLEPAQEPKYGDGFIERIQLAQVPLRFLAGAVGGLAQHVPLQDGSSVVTELEPAGTAASTEPSSANIMVRLICAPPGENLTPNDSNVAERTGKPVDARLPGGTALNP